MTVSRHAERPTLVVVRRTYAGGAKFKDTYTDMAEAQEFVAHVLKGAITHNGGTVLKSFTVSLQKHKRG